MTRCPITTLARKELFTLFNSPATYVVCVVFLVTSGWLFAVPLFQVGQSSLDTFLRPLPLLFALLIPALTMRSFSGEFKDGTIEYLATLPIKDYEIVLGKYLGAMGWLSVIMLFTLAYPVIIQIIGRPDIGQIIGSYAAVFGLSAFFCAIGLWASALTRNQVVAFILSVVICLFLLLAGFNPVTDLLTRWASPALVDTVAAFSVVTHFDGFQRGVIDTRDLAFFLSVIGFALFATGVILRGHRAG